MKHLKEYNIFESRDTYHLTNIIKRKRELQIEVDDLISILKDLTLDIKDKDIKAEIIRRPTTGHYSYYIQIIISKNDQYDEYSKNQSFNLTDIKDEIIQIVDFMKNNGWVVSNSSVVDGGIYDVIVKDD